MDKAILFSLSKDFIFDPFCYNHYAPFPSETSDFLLLYHLIEDQQKKETFCPTYFYITAREEKAKEKQKNFSTFLKYKKNEKIKSFFYPSWNESLQWNFIPSPQTRWDRLKALHALCFHQNDSIVIFTTLPALFQSTLSQKDMLKNSFTYQEGDILESRELFEKKWIFMGYQKDVTAKEPGFYTKRGGVIDVFCPAYSHPFRFTLEGNTIKKIRFFDPLSHRSLDSILDKKIIFSPAREVLFFEDNGLLLKKKIKQFSEDQNLSRSVRHILYENSLLFSSPLMSDLWSSFAYEEPKCLLNFLKQEDLFFWNHPESCVFFWEQIKNHRRKELEKPEMKEKIIPLFDHLFLENEKNKKKLEEKSHHFFYDHSFDNKDFFFPFLEKKRKITKKRLLFSVPSQQTEESLRKHFDEKKKIIFFVSSATEKDVLKNILLSYGTSQWEITVGFFSESIFHEKIIFLSKKDFPLSWGITKKKSLVMKEKQRPFGLPLAEFHLNDYVIHQEHGVGQFQGIKRLTHHHTEMDFFCIQFAKNDRLFLPIYRFNTLYPYPALRTEKIILDSLGSQRFEKAKNQVKKTVEKLALNLIQLYAQRQKVTAPSLSISDEELEKFSSEFPYEETPDQLQAMENITQDLASSRPMDRLLCGDVGFGKTEIAMRAAFLCVLSGKQVAVLTPTSLLTYQHEKRFSQRFSSYPFLIDSLSRLKKVSEQKKIIQDIRDGKKDIIIGTHRLLSPDVSFANLGLFIIDEEHRFGVEHKERIKKIKTQTHCLTLSATPLPRTLWMALSGLKEFSFLQTPPVQRQPIETHILEESDSVISQGIERELMRGGQVFFLVPRIAEMSSYQEKIKKLVPQAKIGMIHGQLSEVEIEKEIISFMEGKNDILICTTIIESGLDFPQANTLFVLQPDFFGLSQLHQIRGRIGRSHQKAFAYFLLPKKRALSSSAIERLDILEKYSYPGCGFHISSMDLEFRGGGDLLGIKQSGHQEIITPELYCDLLAEEVQRLQSEKIEQTSTYFLEPEIHIPGYSAFLSENYMPEIHHRLSYYQKLSSARSSDEVCSIEEEWMDLFGFPPKESKNLLWIIRLKIFLKKHAVRSFFYQNQVVTFLFVHDFSPLFLFFKNNPSQVRQMKEISSRKMTVIFFEQTLEEMMRHCEKISESIE